MRKVDELVIAKEVVCAESLFGLIYDVVRVFAIWWPVDFSFFPP